jgi:dTDP-3-amino-2,3,6-trideoxy-4-keto-D-glucose/dTDP-3-amino-3,4,6-trideoxy-alpha-D-glucose/dTDP-2,6-dideoxy-D-kanosamine transaminase
MTVPFNDLRRLAPEGRDQLTAAAARVIASGWWVHGPEHEAFEAEWAAYCGARHAIAVANGTDALELMLRALDLRPGDEVLTAANAGFYTATACLAAGAVPVFADIDPVRMTLAPAAVAAALGPRTRAVVATHLYGAAADMAGLAEAIAATGSQAILLEDCAQAHGCATNRGRAGTAGLMASFSFYPTKNLGALGDGGAITTSDDALAARLREIRQYGWTERYRSSRPGRNSRLDEMQAAFLRLKLPHLDATNARRRAILTAYQAAAEGGALDWGPPPDAAHVAHLAVVRVPERDAFRAAFQAAGIATAIHYPVPDHQQASLAGRTIRVVGLPETERTARTVVSLPCFPELTDAEVGHIVETLGRWGGSPPPRS